MKKIRFNPFNDFGITNYEQFKLYPFLIFGTLDSIKNRVQQQIRQIKDGYNFGDRLIILGERGIGKTSTLFFIKKMLEKEDVAVELFSRLPEDEQHFQVLTTKIMGDPQATSRIETKQTISKLSSEPIYLLVDFPDTIESRGFKLFLNFLWTLMIHKNYNKINLIFSMNKSHYDKSFSYSQILGKFLTMRLERLNYQETKELIMSRLKKFEEELGNEGNLFPEDVLEIIFRYSKGIPRNVISACGLLFDNINGNEVTKKFTEGILKDKYVDQVINDRVEDLALKKIYKEMTLVLEEKFEGTAESQGEYVKEVMERCGIGRNSVLKRIEDLVKFGIFNQYKGGYNRINKILSFDEV